jgi:hypothetical protein
MEVAKGSVIALRERIALHPLHAAALRIGLLLLLLLERLGKLEFLKLFLESRNRLRRRDDGLRWRRCGRWRCWRFCL